MKEMKNYNKIGKKVYKEIADDSDAKTMVSKIESEDISNFLSNLSKEVKHNTARKKLIEQYIEALQNNEYYT